MSHNHCHDEHTHAHGHDHSHAGHDHTDDLTPALQTHLYQQIHWDGVRTLNEAHSGSGQRVLQKTWAQRLDASPEIESDADEQLILHVPFTGQVRLHSIHLRTSESGSAPSRVKVYVNRDDLDFENISSVKATQESSLSSTSEVQDLLVKRALFNSTQSLTLFFESNFGTDSGDEEEVSRVGYVGFKGDFMRLNKEGVEFLYESAARPEDHKIQGRVGAGMGSSDLNGGGPRGL